MMIVVPDEQRRGHRHHPLSGRCPLYGVVNE